MQRIPILIAVLFTFAGTASAQQDTVTVATGMEEADRRFEERLLALSDSIAGLRDRRSAAVDTLREQIALMERRQLYERERFFNVSRLKYNHGYALVGEMQANTRSLRDQMEIIQFFGTFQQLTNLRQHPEFMQTFNAVLGSIPGNNAERTAERNWLNSLLDRATLPQRVERVAQVASVLNGASFAASMLGSALSAIMPRHFRGAALVEHHERSTCALTSVNRLYEDMAVFQSANARLRARYDTLAQVIERERTQYASSLGFAGPPAAPVFYTAVRDTFDRAIASPDARYHALYDRVGTTIENAEWMMVQYHAAVLEYVDTWSHIRESLAVRRTDPCVVRDSGLVQNYESAIAQADAIIERTRQSYLFTSTRPDLPHHDYYRLVTGKYTAGLRR